MAQIVRNPPESACSAEDSGFNHWVGKIPRRREWQPTPLFWPGEFLGQRNLAGHSPRGCKTSDTTERLTLSYFIGTILVSNQLKLRQNLPSWDSPSDQCETVSILFSFLPMPYSGILCDHFRLGQQNVDNPPCNFTWYLSFLGKKMLHEKHTEIIRKFLSFKQISLSIYVLRKDYWLC